MKMVLIQLLVFLQLIISVYSQDSIIRRFRNEQNPPASRLFEVTEILKFKLNGNNSSYVNTRGDGNRESLFEGVLLPSSLFGEGRGDSGNMASKDSRNETKKSTEVSEFRPGSEKSEMLLEEAKNGSSEQKSGNENKTIPVSNLGGDSTSRDTLEGKSLREEKTLQQLRKELIDNSFAKLMDLMEEEVNRREFTPMDKFDPNISLVIPVAFDDLRSFPVLLSSLRLQTLRPEEIVIVFDVPEDEVEAREKVNREIEKYSDSLRNLRPFFRTPPPPPKHRPGSNRLFGASKARNEIVMFFDSDDIIHPQRVEYVSRAFKQNPDMDAFLTEYFVELMDTTEQAEEMPTKSMEDLKREFDLDMLEKESGGLIRKTYEEERNEARRAVEEYGLKCPWDPNDRKTEINWPETHGWWLYCCHNGWLTIKRSVLIEVPYPDKTSGEDSLYVFRLLMSGKNLGHSKVPLGIYVLGNTYRVR